MYFFCYTKVYFTPSPLHPFAPSPFRPFAPSPSRSVPPSLHPSVSLFLSAIRSQPSALRSPLSALCSPPSALRSPLFALCSMLHAYFRKSPTSRIMASSSSFIGSISRVARFSCIISIFLAPIIQTSTEGFERTNL